ncbi:hypothetical protein ANRL1_03410 [Anaerolineae bacterium]|nr:hypothetical protein ANRL1_03410 [Anaerolineae bacterium]
MRLKSKVLLPVVCLAVSLGASTVHAQLFGMPKIPSVTGGSSGGSTSINGAELAKNVVVALTSFAKAQLGLADALGGYTNYAAGLEAVQKMNAGDPAYKVSKSDIQTTTTISKPAQEFIDSKIKENVKLDADQKKKAAAAALDYVKGLAATTKLTGNVQDVAKNPTSLGMDAGTLVYAAKEMPGVVSGGVSTTSSLISYLSAQGVDTKAVKAELDAMPK